MPHLAHFAINANDVARARRFYERLGFKLKKAFGAHAWVRPPARIDLPA